MKCTVDKQRFESIKDFTTYLETKYEREATVSGEVNVSLEFDVLSKKNRDELVQFILKPERNVVYQFELRPKDSLVQLEFDNAYLAKKRQKFSFDFQQQIAEVSRSVVLPPQEHKVRKAKKHWVEGTKFTPVGLQLREQSVALLPPLAPKALQRQRKNQDELPPDEHQEPITPLTSSPELFAKAHDVVGSYEQFSLLNKASENLSRYEAEFHTLFARQSNEKQRKEAFRFFLAEGTSGLKLERIQQLLKIVPLTDPHYQGLAQVLIHSGADGVLLLLHHFKTLHDAQLLNDFSARFLNKPENYVSLVTTQGFENLKKLGKLSQEQKAWWISLVVQHNAAGARTDFNELFSAYDYFLNQLEGQKLKLPRSCALENIGDMKSALERLLFILSRSSDPQEQLTCLDGLDFGMYGAYYASRYNGYKLVSRQMNLTPDSVDDKPDYTLAKMPDEYYKISRLASSYSQTAERFYRLIGQQEWAFRLDVYQNMEQAIKQNQKLDEQTKALLLDIIVLTTTGQRACTKTDYPLSSCTNLLEKLDPKNQLSTTVPFLLESLSNCSWESMPTVDELNTLVDTLLCMQELKVSDYDSKGVIVLALDLIANFDDAFGPFINNYMKRVAVERTKTIPIPSFSFDKLLSHLLTHSKLNKFLPELFADQPESLTPFILLLTLVNDPVLGITTDGEHDSEFEAKIKALAQSIHSMQAERRAQLLALLTDINIENSYCLPSLDNLIKIADLVSKQEEPLSKLQGAEKQRAAIFDLVSTELPYIRIGKTKINESPNLYSLIKKDLDQLHFDFYKIPDKLQSYLEPWYDAHEATMAQFGREPVNIEWLLETLVEEQKEVTNLLGGWSFFSRTLSSIPQAKDQMAQFLGVNSTLINEFFTTKSLLILVKPRIEASYQSSLRSAVTSLQTANKDFDDFLLTHMKEINVNLPIDKAFLEISQQFDEVNGLINALVRIKNTSNLEFHRCLSLLLEKMKPTVPARAMLTVAQMRKLLETLGQEDDLQTAPLDTICNLLKQVPNYSAEQLNNALSDVTYLSKNKKILGTEAYEILLRLSFSYNLKTQATLFPVKEVIQFNSITGVDERHKKDFFDSFINLVKYFGPDIDDKITKELIDKTASVIQVKIEQVPDLLPLLTLLIKACEKSGKDGVLRYHTLIKTIEGKDAATLNYWAKILTTLAERSTDDKMQLILLAQEGLALNPLNLPELAGLFDYPPYPEIEHFTKILHGYVKDLRIFVDAFDKDPKSARAPQKNAFGLIQKSREQILNAQFETSQVARIIGQLKNNVDGAPLSSQEQYDLAQQIIYINAIGKDKPFTLALEDGSLTKKHDLTKISRAELRKLSDTLIATVRKPGLDADAKVKAQLRVLAVLRENYFRVTGKWINSTELLAVLMSLKNPQSNMLELIDPETDRGAINALLAVMQWIDADGGTVDVCQLSRGAAIEEYHNKGAADFFTFLGIASSRIEGNSAKGSYKVVGINYSTLGDLALYRYRAKVENELLAVKKGACLVSSNLIINATDFSKLDERTLFSISSPEGGARGDNPYKWVYPVINEFINQKKFKLLERAKGWHEEQDVDILKEFLDKHAPTVEHKEQLKHLSAQQIHFWINAAIEAHRLVEDKDFVIPSSETSLHSAVPFTQKAEQDAFVFSKGVHQFLHARLQNEYPAWEFPIESESDSVDSVSLKDLFDDYKPHGRIIGISEPIPLEAKEDLGQQCAKLHMDVCTIPAQLEKTSKDLVTPLPVNKEIYPYVLNAILEQAEKSQPILIIAKDAREVSLLQKQLNSYSEAMNFKMNAFGGTESEKDRRTWIKEKAGKPNTITISTASLVRDTEFHTRNPKGFLAIQTHLDTSRDTYQFLSHLARKGRPGKYISIYEDHGTVFNQPWFYKSENEHKQIFAALKDLKKQQLEGDAVERHYRQRVSEIQQVVLHQFAEWKEFLHLLYPQTEWRKIDAELISQREDLSCSLEEQWAECLELSDPEKTYHNPYVRRDANNKVQTKALDKIVHTYENAVSTIWNQSRATLKKKADAVIKEGSFHALHCHYLDTISLHEHIQSHKLLARENKNQIRAEKKKARRYVTVGLDVNGAMLQYSDGNRKTYSNAFKKNLVAVFADDISTILANSTALSKTLKSVLIHQVKSAPSLNVLIGLLIDYGSKDLPEERFAEKYAMQPIVQELLWTYQRAGFEETEELQQLKELYLDDVAEEIVADLEAALSWAMEEHRGLGYLLERSAVTTAADAILLAVNQLKIARDPLSRQIAVRNLYKVLTEHEAKLEGLWIFSFGHKNTRTLIKQTLSTLNGLTAIGSGENELDADFIHDCKEGALYDVMKDKFTSIVNVMQADKSKALEGNAEWQAIINRLNVIQAENNNAYAFYEMYYFLLNKVEELGKKHSKLQGPVTQLRGEVRSIFDKFYQEHKDSLNESKYFAQKAETLKTKLTGLNGLNVTQVKINTGNNGFTDYFDLIIEGCGSSPLLDNFTQYHSRSQELTKEFDILEKKLAQANKLLASLDKLLSEQLPLLKAKASTNTHPARFPKQFQAQVIELQTIKGWGVDHVPENLSTFPKDVQDLFHDRELVKTFKFPNIQAEDIAQLKSVILRIGFEDLREKMVEAAKPKSFWANLTSYAASYLPEFIYSPEDMEYWQGEFDYLQGSPSRKLKDALQPEIDKKQATLETQMKELRQQTFDQKENLQQQITFLREKIDEEDAKSGVYMKRFTSQTDLLDFEEKVTDIKAKQMVLTPDGNTSEDNLLHLLDLVPDSEIVEERESETFSLM